MSDDTPQVPPTDWSVTPSADDAREGLQHGAVLAALVNGFLRGDGTRRTQLRAALARYDAWAEESRG